MADPYSVGTISVANGNTVVTGTNTFWIGSVRKNDMLLDPAQGLVALVTADATENEELSIDAWPGLDIVDGAYKIIPAADSTSNTARLRELLAQMSVIEANGRGLFFRFSDTTTDADPGPGFFRLNNANPALATAAFIDVLDANGASVAGEIDTWADSSSLIRGNLWVRSIADPTAFHAYAVTGSVVDGTGYRKLTLEQIGGSGSFAANDELMVAFARTGDAGDGYITDATVADPSELAALESEDPGYLVFVTDLETDFGAYSGRSGVVRLIAGPDWEVVTLYTGPQGIQGPQGEQGEQGEQGKPGLNGEGTVASVEAGAGISVDDTDMTAPVVSVVAFTGDSGTGGTLGGVPAPAAGDSAASRFLRADGTWARVGFIHCFLGTIPGTASFIDVSGWPADAEVVEIDISGIRPATAGQNLRMRYSADGVTFPNADYEFTQLRVVNGTGSTSVGGGGLTEFVLSSGMSNAVGSAAKIILYRPGDSDRCEMQYSSAGRDNSGNAFSASGGGQRDASASVGAIRLFVNSGNLAAGRVSARFFRAAL